MCATSPSRGAPAPLPGEATGAGNEFRIAVFSCPAALNPVYAADETSQAVLNKVHRALYRFDEQGRLQGELVESDSWDPQANAARLRLKGGFFFANGRPLGAADVASTIRLLQDPAFSYPYRGDLDFIRAVRLLAPRDIMILFRGPFAPWKSYLTFKVLCQAEIGAMSAAAFQRLIPCGAGPFRIERIEEPDAILLTPNPQARPSLRRSLRYVVLRDPRAAPLKLLAGEIDAAELQPEDARAYADIPSWRDRFRLLKYNKFGYTYLAFRMRDARLDAALRRRIAARLLGGDFLERFLQGSGERVNSPFPLLTVAERAAAAQNGLATKAGGPRSGSLILRILTNSESRLRRNLALFIQAELAPLGIALEPEFLEYQGFLKRLRQGDFDLALSAYLLDIDNNLSDVLGSRGPANYAGYARREMDRLLEAGLAEMNEGARREIYLRAHRLWADDLPLLPLFSLNYYVAVARGVSPPADLFRFVGSTGDFFYDIGRWLE